MYWAAVLVGSIVACYFWLRHRYSYFKRLNVPHDSPPWILGSGWKTLIGKDDFNQSFHRIYNQYCDEPLVGLFLILTPTLIIKDSSLLRKMLVDDFSSFHSHGLIVGDDQTNPLEGHLFNLSGEKWRTLRRKLAPTFTSGKLKWMYKLIDECVKSLMNVLSDNLSKSQDVEVRDLLARFTTDVIGSCAFGLDAESLKDKDSPFRKMGSQVFNGNWKQMVFFILMMAFPKIVKYLKLKTMPDEVIEFYLSVVKQGLEHRQKTGKTRNDLLQLLLELKMKGSVDIDPRDELLEEGHQESLGEEEKIELTDEVLAAQAFLFFIAGFETTAATLGFILYYLSKDRIIQDKARAEVLATANDGGITYEALANMSYLSACISEGLRLEPPFRVVFRECTRDTILGGVPIKKGLLLGVPIYSVHRDPTNFRDPDTFRPERFIEEPNPKPGTYLPFGDGPRTCIARRFALLEAKLALARILSEYVLEPSEKMKEPLTMDPRSPIPSPIGGTWIKFTKL